MMGDRCLLYYITDGSQFPGNEPSRRHALLAKIAEAARAGVDYIQLREKDLSTRELEMLAREVVATVRENSPSTRLLINSRTDVALAVGADGVHLRSDDIGAREVRRMFEGPQGLKPSSLFVASDTTEVVPFPKPAQVQKATTGHFFVALSCHTSSDVLRAESEGADFAAFAPVFEKRTAPATQAKGLSALREACTAKIPVLALGGVTVNNAAECLAAGAAGDLIDGWGRNLYAWSTGRRDQPDAGAHSSGMVFDGMRRWPGQ